MLSEHEGARAQEEGLMLKVAPVAFVVAALFSLSGCSIPWHPAHSLISYAPADGRPVIVCLGDSLTAGDAAPADQSYPARLQRRLNAGGYRYRVVNAGVSGNRVADGLSRMQSDVLGFHPFITIVELGSNDPGRTGATVWRAQLQTIVRRL